MDCGEETGKDYGNRKATSEAITNIQQKKLWSTAVELQTKNKSKDIFKVEPM